MRRAIVIGDVHGCREELEALVRACGVTPEDQVFLVGDLVAKGPDSQGVVQLAREQGYLAVLGNHDAHLLQIRAGTVDRKPKATHLEAARAFTGADWAYLESLPLWRRIPGHDAIVVHGGLVPGVPLEAQAREHLLTLRSIRPDGTPSKKVDEGVPWASLWPGPEHVIFGHDAIRGLQQYPFATGLDTGCVYGGALTAILLPERRFVSVPARRVYSPPGH